MFNIRDFIHDLKNLTFQQSKVQEESKVNLLPSEMIIKIFSYLTSEELGKCLLVNKTWHLLASNEHLWKALTLRIAFGKKQWATYLGDIGEEPPLPDNVFKILRSPCPFEPKKKVEETHMLVLIPKTIDGKLLTLRTLEELMKSPKKGSPVQYQYIWNSILTFHGDQSASKSHWVIMKKEIIPGSRRKSYLDQKSLIAKVVHRTGMNYEVPSVLDTIICTFANHVTFGQRLFNDKPWTYTRCKEKVYNYRVIVGGFSPAGLRVNCNKHREHFIGMAPLCRI